MRNLRAFMRDLLEMAAIHSSQGRLVSCRCRAALLCGPKRAERNDGRETMKVQGH